MPSPTPSTPAAVIAHRNICHYLYGGVLDVLSCYTDQCIPILINNDLGKRLYGFAQTSWETSTCGSGSFTSLQRDCNITYDKARRQRIEEIEEVF